MQVVRNPKKIISILIIPFVVFVVQLIFGLIYAYISKKNFVPNPPFTFQDTQALAIYLHLFFGMLPLFLFFLVRVLILFLCKKYKVNLVLMFIFNILVICHYIVFVIILKLFSLYPWISLCFIIPLIVDCFISSVNIRKLYPPLLNQITQINHNN